MIIIAGSGPSVLEYNKPVTIATKKRSLPSEYIALKDLSAYRRYLPNQDRKIIAYRRRCRCGACGDCPKNVDFVANDFYWDNYFRQFSPKPINGTTNPKKIKASLGTLAVFMAVERFKPETIGLIGFDWVLDVHPGWRHDALAERQAILSLVNIVDLRNDTYLRRVRPA